MFQYICVYMYVYREREIQTYIYIFLLRICGIEDQTGKRRVEFIYSEDQCARFDIVSWMWHWVPFSFLPFLAQTDRTQ